MISWLLLSCGNNSNQRKTSEELQGTWQLISGTIIEKGDTTTTHYTKNPMITVIIGTHFAFLNHDLFNGNDSTALFVAGGGRYDLNGDQYTEHLEYCSVRAWEGHDLRFTVKIQNDTLTQSGVEVIEETRVNRMNIEKYARVKK